MTFAIRPMNNEHQRFCSGACAETLPLTDEYFYRRKKNSLEFHYKCKNCMRKVTGEHSKKMRERARLRSKGQQPIVIRTDIDVKLYSEAKYLCGLNHGQIVDIIADFGLSGLSNFVADQHNWIE